MTDCEQLQLELQEYAEAKLTNTENRFAGLMIGVDTPACGAVVVTAGLANVDPETPMSPEHMLPISSISKMFVAARVLQLVEEGELSLDDELRNWWTKIPYSQDILVRHLLNNTSGAPSYFTDECLNGIPDTEHDWTIEEMLSCIEGKDLTNVPGERFNFSNTNYVLLGHIVGALTGNTLHEELRSSLLSPLGLDHTFSLSCEDPPGDVASSYEWDGSWTDVTDTENYSFCYADNVASNASDLLAWMRGLFAGNTLQATTLNEMTDCVDMGYQTFITDTFWEEGYGLGIICAHDTNAGEVHGHMGGLYTVMSEAWYSPSWDTSVVVLINHGVIGLDYEWRYPMVSDLFAIAGEHR